MVQRILGLGGFKESGKDAFALALPRDKWDVIGMSDPLRQASTVLKPFLVDLQINVAEAFQQGYSYGELKAASRDYREFLQRLGTDFGRDMISENVWVDIARDSIVKLTAQGRSVAITGIRFANEIELIKDLGGTTAWVDRPGLEGAADAHASENSVNASFFDVVIDNSGTLEDLQNQAREFGSN